MNSNQRGFGLAQTLLLLVLVGLIGGTGWYVYRAQKNTNNSLDNAASNLQAIANQKNNTKDAAIQDESSEWQLFEPSDKSFTVRIPDGWQAVSLYDNLYVRDADKLLYKQGIKAQIEVLAEGGWDGPSPFSLYYPKQNYDQIVREGTKQDDIETSSGLKAEKYMFTQETEPDGIGYQKGDRVYNYYFGADAKYVQIQYVVHEGNTDQFKLVEKLVRTLKVN